ncbi:GntR family transcriptional regulator [Streptomyces sp. NPDC058695]|uniref:GntR family transcriptional regulator n=1 Tax=Streptomyces sp. NPDC058695 TaxID=3346604 RepID=UPI00365C9C91
MIRRREAALVEKYGISRGKARRAVRELETAGHVEARRGVGRFVSSPSRTPDCFGDIGQCSWPSRHMALLSQRWLTARRGGGVGALSVRLLPGTEPGADVWARTPSCWRPQPLRTTSGMPTPPWTPDSTWPTGGGT